VQSHVFRRRLCVLRLAQVNQQKKSAVLFVGFALLISHTNLYFFFERRTEIEKNFILKVVRPKRPELAVVSGAVSFGITPNFVTTRIAARTYGIEVASRWVPAYDVGVVV